MESKVVQFRTNMQKSAEEVLQNAKDDVGEFAVVLYKGKDGTLWFQVSENVSKLEVMGALAALQQDIWNDS